MRWRWARRRRTSWRRMRSPWRSALRCAPQRCLSRHARPHNECCRCKTIVWGQHLVRAGLGDGRPRQAGVCYSMRWQTWAMVMHPAALTPRFRHCMCSQVQGFASATRANWSGTKSGTCLPATPVLVPLLLSCMCPNAASQCAHAGSTLACTCRHKCSLLWACCLHSAC